MDELRIFNYLTNIQEEDNIRLSGRLLCDCGCDKFSIYHTGKQTKGILRPDIVKENKKIIIVAKCSQCHENITILDTSIDGIEVTSSSTNNLKQLIIKEDIKKFKVILYYNYFKTNFKSNYFLDLFIDVEAKELKKKRRIFE